MVLDRAGTAQADVVLMTDGTQSAQPLQPQRTCVGCRGKANRSSLLRVVLNCEGTALVLDESRAMPGRGAWLHPEADCLEKATTRKAWSRALKVHRPVQADLLHQALVERISTTSPEGDTQQKSHLVASHDHDRKRV